MLAVLRRSLLMRGYINTDFVEDHYDDFMRDLSPLVASGRIRYREDIVDGLDNAPEAFIGMLSGRNFGKLLVKVGCRMAPAHQTGADGGSIEIALSSAYQRPPLSPPLPLSPPHIQPSPHPLP